MRSTILRSLFFVLISVALLLLGALVYLFFTRSDLLRAGYLNPAPGVLFYDDFSRFYSGWDIQKGEEGSTGYSAGTYEIRVGEPNLDLWGTAGLELEDVSIEVNVSRVAGPESGSMGIICRYQDTDNFYFGIITGNGYYGIGEYAEGGMRMLTGSGLKPTGSGNGGSRPEHLRFDCIDTTLSFYLNGTLIETVGGADRSSGDIGVIAGTLEEPGVTMRFDDFVVFTP